MKKYISLFVMALMLSVSLVSYGAELTNGPQTIHGTKTFDQDVIVKKNLTIEGSIKGAAVRHGNVFFVSSVTGVNSTGNYGTSYDKPFATIDYAIGQCSANHGDIIYVLPNHSETASAADTFDADVAGISIIGIGEGTDMPMIDYTNAAGEVAIGAAGVTIEGINFHSNVTDVLIAVSVEAAGDYLTIRNCVFDVETTTTDEFAVGVDIAAGANYVTVDNCRMDMGLGGAVAGVLFNGASAGGRITNNWIIGDYSTACIAGATAASTLLDIGYNRLFNGAGSNIGTEPGIDLNGNSTGMIYNNFIACNLATKAAAIVAAKCMLFENYYNEDVSGAGTGGLIGTASADDE